MASDNQRFGIDRSREEIDATWKAIESSYDIEPREQLEAEARVNGFRFGLCQAVHHMWKRDPKVEEILRDTQVAIKQRDELQAQLAAAEERAERADALLDDCYPLPIPSGL